MKTDRMASPLPTEKKKGDRVNIELDARTVAIVDTVERVLAERET